MKEPHIAVFLYSVDPLFLPKKYQEAAYVIVAKDTPFFIFSQSLFLHDHIIAIPMHHSEGVDLTERQMLYHPDCIKLIKEKQITHLVIPSKCTKVMKDWAKEFGIILIGPSYSLQHKLENKLYFDSLLKASHLSSPATLTVDTLPTFPPPYVVQEPTNWGLLGTSFCQTREAVQQLIEKNKRKLLVRQFLEGMPIGVSILVDTAGNYVFSAIRRQCFSTKEGFPTVFLGIQWLPSNFFSPQVTRDIYELLGQLAKILVRMKFIGIANIDLVIHNNTPYILECNPRLSAATAQTFSVPDLTGSSDPYAFFLHSFLQQEISTVQNTIPNSAYTGSFLAIDITDNTTITRLPKIGIYSMQNNTLLYTGTDMNNLHKDKTVFLVHYLQKPGMYKEETEVATIVSHAPLFSSESGTLNSFGQIVYNFFMDAFFTNL